MNVRYTLQELGEWAIRETGFCAGVYWTSVRGSRVAEGMLSANCRLAYLFFSGWAPAYRFYELLTHRQAERLPRQKIRLASVEHAGQRLVGVTVVAVLSPDRDEAQGIRRLSPVQR